MEIFYYLQQLHLLLLPLFVFLMSVENNLRQSTATVRLYFEPPSFSCFDFRLEFMHFFDIFTRNSYFVGLSAHSRRYISFQRFPILCILESLIPVFIEFNLFLRLGAELLFCVQPCLALSSQPFCPAFKRHIQIPLGTQNKLVLPYSKNSKR